MRFFWVGYPHTERGSARLYADHFTFDVLELPTDHRMFSPEVYVEAIKAAEKAGYDVNVVDSLSHAWEGEGGALSLVDQAAAKNRGGNSYVAWRQVTPLHNKLVDTMLQSTAHVIVTMRSKIDYEQVEENGRKQVRKLGMAPIQRAGMEYEFTMVCDMDVDHRLIVSKTRCDQFDNRQIVKPDEGFFKTLGDWLEGGAEPAPKPKIEMKIEPPIKPEWTFANLLKYAEKKYGMTDQAVKELLKANGFSTFTADKYIAAQTVIHMANAKPAEPEELPY